MTVLRRVGSGILGIILIMLLGNARQSTSHGEHSHGPVILDPLQAIERQALTLIESRCALCHSTDLIAQQRLNRARWDATLQKMISWGAQLSAAEQELLLNYLATRQGPDAN
jgi:hypothetical protein